MNASSLVAWAPRFGGERSVTMLGASTIETFLEGAAPEELQRAFGSMLPKGSREERVAAIESALASPVGRAVRAQMGRWIVDRLVPVEHVVPEAYLTWRPPVRDAMLFVVNHLSDARLAPKLLEQLELPPSSRPETRLLRLIARVPGLQKLGQVIARNRHLRPALRRALSELENGIHDVGIAEITSIIRDQLGDRLDNYEVKIQPRILSEASVSAVVRFTWRDAESGERGRGVFKVMKPHIPSCFAEDMQILAELAEHFGHGHPEYGPGAKLIPDTFKKVRRLLRHEVDFAREQKTLLEAGELYADFSGVRVPRVIQALCTDTITAISEEAGAKVTEAAKPMTASEREALAEKIVEALVAVPLFASSEQSLFHGDPHAGNLLYDGRRRELVIIDWALRERLTREQRRQLALLFLMVALRDPVGASNAIGTMAELRVRRGSRREGVIRETVERFLEEIPLAHMPSAVDAMRLLEQVAYRGIRFPGPLIMLSKVIFTLDGILHDLGTSSASMGFAMTRHIVRRWMSARKAFASPLRASDWLSLQCSSLLLGGRLWVRGEQVLLNRLFPSNGTEKSARSR